MMRGRFRLWRLQMPNERLRLHLEGQRIGGCLLIRRISAGGMAEVYLAERACDDCCDDCDDKEVPEEDAAGTSNRTNTWTRVSSDGGMSHRCQAPAREEGADQETSRLACPSRQVAVKVVCPSDEVTRESGLLDIEERFIRRRIAGEPRSSAYFAGLCEWRRARLSLSCHGVCAQWLAGRCHPRARRQDVTAAAVAIGDAGDHSPGGQRAPIYS